MMNAKVYLAPSLESARDFVSKYSVFATVEAEYGDRVIEGRELTLAHHSSGYEKDPAPCCRKDVEKVPDGSLILVSHLDLDTIGGCLALLGWKRKICTKAFWEAAAYIDISGPHRLQELSSLLRLQLQACYAWEADNLSPSSLEQGSEVVDVSKRVEEYAKVIERIANGDSKLLQKGKDHFAKLEETFEKRLMEEDPWVRVFASIGADGFTPASYYSPKQGRVTPATVTFNTEKRAITIAFEDGGTRVSARSLAKELWGEEAGGHPGIAGSPRGRAMGLSDLLAAVDLVRSSLQ